MVYKTITEIKNDAQLRCNKAVKSACERLLEKLRETILEEYYNQYTPKEYMRTFQFLDSAMTKMLTANTGLIYMDEKAMDYKEWTGKLQLEYSSQGYHGSEEIQTDGRFWESFSTFCENNVRQILKEELIKQGVPIIN